MIPETSETSETPEPPATLELEFTVEPFEAGAPGAHVRAAEAAARRAVSDVGVVLIGPFGAAVSGPRDAVLAAVDAVVRAAVEEGASRVTLQVSASTAPDTAAG